MAANFATQYMMPGRRGYGGGMDWLSPVGRSLQARGTPGGTILGLMLQAIGGQHAAQVDEEARGLRNENVQLHNEALRRAMAREDAAAPFNAQNLITDAQHRETQAEQSKLALDQNRRLYPNQARVSDLSTELAQQQFDTAQEQRIRASAKDRREGALRETGQFKEFVATAIKNGNSVSAAIQMALDAGLTPPDAEGASYIPLSEQARQGGAATAEDQMALENNRGLLKRWGIEADNTEKLQTADQARRVGDILGEEKQTVDYVEKLTKNNLALMRGIAGLPEETPVGPPGSEGEPALSADPSGMFTLNIGGQARRLTPERAKQWQDAYNEILFARNAIGQAKANGQPVSMKLLAPLFTTQRATEAIVTPSADNGTRQLAQDYIAGVRPVPVNEIGAGQPAATVPGMFQPTPSASAPRFTFEPRQPAARPPTPGVSERVGELSAGELSLAAQLKQQGYSKEQVGAEILRRRNANTR